MIDATALSAAPAPGPGSRLLGPSSPRPDSTASSSAASASTSSSSGSSSSSSLSSTASSAPTTPPEASVVVDSGDTAFASHASGPAASMAASADSSCAHPASLSSSATFPESTTARHSTDSSRLSSSTGAGQAYRPPRHALMRLRRTSMPNVPMSSDSASQAKTLIPSHITLQKNRLSTASARSCDSLPEEAEGEDPRVDVQRGRVAAAGEDQAAAMINDSLTEQPTGSTVSTLDAPLPKPRIRLKSNIRRSSMSLSGLGDSRAHSHSGYPHPQARSSDSSVPSRPVSLALPASHSPLVASNLQGTTQAVESKTLARNVRRVLQQKQKQKQKTASTSPGKDGGGGPGVRFSTPPRTQSIITSQAYNTAKRVARSSKRDRVANEILETEKVYVAVLNDVHEHFLVPLSALAKSTDPAKPPILSNKAIKEVFANYGDIHNLAREILATLERTSTIPPAKAAPAVPTSMDIFAAAGNAGPARMGSIRAYAPPAFPVPRAVGTNFSPILPFLKCYSLFVGNFANAQARLQEEDKHNEAWREFCAEKRNLGIGNGLSLSAMLLCIVQRIPRYRLLLGDLVRFTDPSDPDYAALQRARASVEDVASHLETSLAQHAASLAILDLQRSLTGLDFPLIAPGRRLLKSGVLIKQGRREEEERAFFLFTDILVYADVAYAGTGYYVAAGWARAVSSSSHLPGVSTDATGMPGPQHHHHHHAAVPSAASEKSRSSIVWSAAGAPSGTTYTFKRKLDLEDVSVAGSEGNAFEILSSVKSFTLIAVSSQSKDEWITALREAKEELLSSRRTLLTEEDEKRRSRMRRLSMPVAPTRSSSSPLLAFAPRSAAPQQEGMPDARRVPMPPLVRLPSNDDDADDNFDDEDAGTSSIFSPSSEISAGAGSSFSRSQPNPPTPSHSSSQRGGSDGYFGSGASSDVAERFPNLRVYEDYSAPIWVPDNRADGCMRCGEAFAVWRRRHHCRLCGDVVCWACSSKKFVIPSTSGTTAARVGRACDECYETCFLPDAPAYEGFADAAVDSPASSSVGSSAGLGPVPLPPLLRKAFSALDVVRDHYTASAPASSDSGTSVPPNDSGTSVPPNHQEQGVGRDDRRRSGGGKLLSASASASSTPRESVDILRSVLARSTG